MTSGALRNDPVTSMFLDRVKPDKIDEYEAWSKRFNGSLKKLPGFMGVDVIRPEDGSEPDYMTLVRFDSCHNLKRWKESPSLATSLENLPKLLVGESLKQECTGLELWFDRPKSTKTVKEPPFWKQVVIGVICVYPLVLMLNLVLGPFTAEYPREIAMLVNVVVLSSLLTYPVMPWMTRLLRAWLYPT